MLLIYLCNGCLISLFHVVLLPPPFLTFLIVIHYVFLTIPNLSVDIIRPIFQVLFLYLLKLKSMIIALFICFPPLSVYLKVVLLILVFQVFISELKFPILVFMNFIFAKIVIIVHFLIVDLELPMYLI